LGGFRTIDSGAVLHLADPVAILASQLIGDIFHVGAGIKCEKERYLYILLRGELTP
jgi:hypothetical protein